MEVFRIAKEKYCNSLTVAGNEARWNKKGEEVLYTAASRSLASLEIIVQDAGIRSDTVSRIMVIYLAGDDDLITQVRQADLPTNWRSVTAYSDLREIGSEWFKKQKSLVLQVPSAIIPLEYNFLINTKHSEFENKIKLITTEEFFWDTRLYKK